MQNPNKADATKIDTIVNKYRNFVAARKAIEERIDAIQRGTLSADLGALARELAEGRASVELHSRAEKEVLAMIREKINAEIASEYETLPARQKKIEDELKKHWAAYGGALALTQFLARKLTNVPLGDAINHQIEIVLARVSHPENHGRFADIVQAYKGATLPDIADLDAEQKAISIAKNLRPRSAQAVAFAESRLQALLPELYEDADGSPTSDTP